MDMTSDDMYEGMGKRIRKLREEKGYSCRDMAVLMNLDVDMIKTFEKGRKRVFVDHISHIATLFDVTADYLIFGKDRI